MFMRIIVILAVLAVALGLSSIPERARGGVAFASHKKTLLTGAASAALTWDAPVDHFPSASANSTATFKQRYFVDAQYSKGPDSPVFYEIGGEGTLSGPPGGFIADLAKEHGALLVALEHRFYGESIPNDSSSTENLQYLTVDQALADLNAFTQFYTKLHSLSGKWFAFGGSYPGALASWYRNAYPDATVGSLSSSGVVNPIVNFPQFDETVSTALGNTCGPRLKQVRACVCVCMCVRVCMPISLHSYLKLTPAPLL